MKIRSESVEPRGSAVMRCREGAVFGASRLMLSSLVCGAAMLLMPPAQAAQSWGDGSRCISSFSSPAGVDARRVVPHAAGTEASLSCPRMALNQNGLSAQMLQQLHDEAEQHYRKGEDVEALRIFSSLIELAPQYRNAAWLRVGNIHQRAGSAGAALDAYRHLLADDSAQSGTLMSDGVSVLGPRSAERGSYRDARAAAPKGSSGRDSEPDVQQQALRLKGMVNLLTLSVAQTQASLDHIALLQQSPAVREAAGLTEQAEAVLVDSVLAQVNRIQQLLGGVPASPGVPSSIPGASGVSGVSGDHAFSRTLNAAGLDALSVDMDARTVRENRAAQRTRHGKVSSDPVGQMPMQKAERDSYRPKNSSPPAMLIGYPVQPGAVEPSASVLLPPTDPAAPIAVGAEVPEGMAGQGSGKAAAKRPVIEYLDEAPAVHVPRRNPA
ncbi:tetratricopeptide repeat protein [Lautropia mirabilis]|uniref:tetratricopeptide repeat protein n=1 Tax=Lautropia mirabilis TaxID=47671 RepID=UPI0023521B65|nr:tetratricopeptide repeat protein [Lautropia mirabilis]